MMGPKRNSREDQDDGSDVPVRESKRLFTSGNVIRDVMKGQEITSEFERFFRRVVQEEAEPRILRYLHSSPRHLHNQNESSGARGLQLHFANKLPSTLFMGIWIRAEDNKPVEIVIRDASSKNIVQYGPLSSIKIKILVLDSDFGTDEKEDWTKEEFNAHVKCEREGKRPLLTGELGVTLRNGVGYIGDITITDNSSWTRSRKFRLGATTVPSEVNIREARSAAFVVKDHRGFMKHRLPSLGDEVWHLKKIAKGGTFHTRLASYGINTVKDFLQLQLTNPSSLRSILGNRISDKAWVKLTESLRPLIEDLKRQAYRNVNDLVPFDKAPAFGLSKPLSNLQAEPFSSSSLVQPETLLCINPSSASPSCTYGVEDSSQLEKTSMAHCCHPMQEFTPATRNSFMMEPYNGGSGWTPSGSLEPIVPTGHLADVEK